MSYLDALIGYTGFVGSNLDRDWEFQAKFNSSNIAKIRNQRFGTVVCAGVSAVKWLANKQPEEDWKQLSSLISHLDSISCDKFVLVSTVDVYANPVGVTEADLPDASVAEPYGKHRRMFETWVEQRFDNHLVVRLPALFGPGLKKNVIFDMMNNNMCEVISPNGVFQWYPIRRFGRDLRIAASARVTSLNIAVEPVSTAFIRAQLFPEVAIGGAELPHRLYDVRTQHAGLLGGCGYYHLDAKAVLEEMEEFIRETRK